MHSARDAKFLEQEYTCELGNSCRNIKHILVNYKGHDTISFIIYRSSLVTPSFDFELESEVQKIT